MGLTSGSNGSVLTSTPPAHLLLEKDRVDSPGVPSQKTPENLQPIMVWVFGSLNLWVEMAFPAVRWYWDGISNGNFGQHSGFTLRSTSYQASFQQPVEALKEVVQCSPQFAGRKICIFSQFAGTVLILFRACVEFMSGT